MHQTFIQLLDCCPLSAGSEVALQIACLVGNKRVRDQSNISVTLKISVHGSYPSFHVTPNYDFTALEQK